MDSNFPSPLVVSGDDNKKNDDNDYLREESSNNAEEQLNAKQADQFAIDSNSDHYTQTAREELPFKNLSQDQQNNFQSNPVHSESVLENQPIQTEIVPQEPTQAVFSNAYDIDQKDPLDSYGIPKEPPVNGEVLSPKPTSAQSKAANSQLSRFFFFVVCAIIGVLLVLIFIAFFSPSYFLTIVNILWLLLLIFALTFVFLGILVVVGLKRDVTKILDILMEGSLKFIDVANFFKKVVIEFKRRVQELLLYMVPLFAIAACALIYLGLMYTYKYFGKDYDVTLLTVVLTVAIIGIFGFLNAPKNESKVSTRWIDIFTKKLGGYFRDMSEIMIFVFFLTMDSDHLFFLPDDLNRELHAQVGDYNLMLRGFNPDHLITTLSIIGLTVIVEVARKFIKIFYLASKFYALEYGAFKMQTLPDGTAQKASRAEILKNAIRKAFDSSKDDFSKFMAYTTVLIIVFVLFPRLKLLAMAVTSITMLILDFLIVERIKETKQDEDLIGRTMAKLIPGLRTNA